MGFGTLEFWDKQKRYSSGWSVIYLILTHFMEEDPEP
jgi:hypothetical protein